MDNQIVLKYIGNGGMIPDPPVPARDLTGEDIRACGLTREQLIASGMYAAADVPKKPVGKSEAPARFAAKEGE